jgi:hypothetical protein
MKYFISLGQSIQVSIQVSGGQSVGQSSEKSGGYADRNLPVPVMSVELHVGLSQHGHLNGLSNGLL